MNHLHPTLETIEQGASALLQEELGWLKWEPQRKNNLNFQYKLLRIKLEDREGSRHRVLHNNSGEEQNQVQMILTLMFSTHSENWRREGRGDRGKSPVALESHWDIKPVSPSLPTNWMVTVASGLRNCSLSCSLSLEGSPQQQLQGATEWSSWWRPPVLPRLCWVHPNCPVWTTPSSSAQDM